MTDFRQALIDALLRHPSATRTNTPVDVLAGHMVHSLNLFEASIIERSQHPFYSPGKVHAPISPPPSSDPPRDPGPDLCGLYRDRPVCAACEGE